MGMHKVALVLAGGAFGTSVANLISENFKKVYILVRSQDVYQGINNGENDIYLPGKKLNKNVSALLSVDDLGSDKDNIELIVSGLPTSAIVPFFNANREIIENFLNRKISFCQVFLFPLENEIF